jgi:hypothetical protein
MPQRLRLAEEACAVGQLRKRQAVIAIPESSPLELAAEREVDVNTRIRPLKRHGDT